MQLFFAFQIYFHASKKERSLLKSISLEENSRGEKVGQRCSSLFTDQHKECIKQPTKE